MGGRRAASGAPVYLALAMVAVAVVASAAAEGAGGEEKCGGCAPCVGPDCPGTVVYPSPPPPPHYYYSPPPPASYPGVSGNCPPSPGGYIEIGSTPPGKGPLYPQDPGFMPSGATRRAVPVAVAAFAALAGAWAFVL